MTYSQRAATQGDWRLNELNAAVDSYATERLPARIAAEPTTSVASERRQARRPRALLSGFASLLRQARLATPHR